MPHHYKKKHAGPKQPKSKSSDKKPAHVGVKRKKKTGPQQTHILPKRKPQPPSKRKKWVNPGWNPEGATLLQRPVRTDKLEDRPGFFMKMGSKQKNTASNFSESAFKMVTGPGGSAGMGGMDPGDDFFKNIDPMNSLGQDQVENMNETYNEMKAGYQQPVELVSKNTSGSPEAYASLGAGLRNLLKPKPGSQAEANQQYRQKAREAKRKADGGTYVGNKLRDIFKTGKKNKNLKKYAKKPQHPGPGF